MEEKKAFEVNQLYVDKLKKIRKYREKVAQDRED